MLIGISCAKIANRKPLTVRGYGEYQMVTRLHNVNGIVGDGVKFERIRRVTGYLVGTLDRFNNGKRAEERDRVKHMHLK